VLQAHLTRHEHLLGRFSVADAYLTAVLNWAPYSGVELGDWPAVQQYHRRMLQRPSIALAVAEEFALYQEEQARRAKAA
jgi:glutathione S-transferase